MEDYWSLIEGDLKELPAIGSVPYDAFYSKHTVSQSVFSAIVSDALGVTYDVFLREYDLDGVWGFYKSAPVPIFERIDSGLFTIQESTSGGLNFPAHPKTQDWGTFFFDRDAVGDNAAFGWIFNPFYVDEGESPTIFFRFIKGGRVIYFHWSAVIAPRPTVVFANKFLSHWFDDIDGEPSNTVRLSVPPPTSGNVMQDIEIDFNGFFTGNMPEVVPDAASDPVYRSHAAETRTYFRFAKEQPEINGYQLCTNWWDDGSVIYVPKKEKGKTVTDSAGHPQLFSERIIAELGGDYFNVIIVEDTPWTRDMINYWGHRETDRSRMVYFNIIARSCYGPQFLPLNEIPFHARLIRPVDVFTVTQEITDPLKDYQTRDDYYVPFRNFISGIKDWNGKDVFSTLGCFSLKEYYGIESIVFHFGLAWMQDPANPSRKVLLRDAKPGVEVYGGRIGPKGYTFSMVPDEIYPVADIFSDVNTPAISVFDPGSTSPYTFFVPFELSYRWGPECGVIEIHFKPASR